MDSLEELVANDDRKKDDHRIEISTSLIIFIVTIFVILFEWAAVYCINNVDTGRVGSEMITRTMRSDWK